MERKLCGKHKSDTRGFSGHGKDDAGMKLFRSNLKQVQNLPLSDTGRQAIE